MSMLGFQTLHCPKCDGTKILLASEVIWQEGKGQAFRPAGPMCITCMKPFDAEGSIRKLKQKELADKIKELQNG